MAVRFEVPEPFNSQRWQIKIRDKERTEPPHVSILFRRQTWRVGIRDGQLLDRQPSPRLLPRALLDHVRANLSTYGPVWDAHYSENLVGPSAVWITPATDDETEDDGTTEVEAATPRAEGDARSGRSTQRDRAQSQGKERTGQADRSENRSMSRQRRTTDD